MSKQQAVRLSKSLEGALSCPVCGFDYTHQLSTEIFQRSEDENDGTHVKVCGDTISCDRDISLNPSPRRQGVTINMRCESDHYFNLHIYQHKGQTYLETEC